MNETNQLLRDFFRILDTVEETDDGREFHPTTFGSCRCLDAQRGNEILARLKELCQPLPKADNATQRAPNNHNKMSYSIKTIGKPADVAAVINAQTTMPPGVKAALLETVNDIKPEYGDFVVVEAYGHFGGGYSNIGKIEVNYLKAAPPAPEPAVKAVEPSPTVDENPPTAGTAPDAPAVSPTPVDPSKDAAPTA